MSTGDNESFVASKPHCGVCEHLYFRSEWHRPPYCTKKEQTTSITVGDVCSAFSLRSDLGSGPLELDAEIKVDWTEEMSGTEAPFYATYEDEERYGFMCGNCETFDIGVGPMGRIICNHCENTHSPADWDRAYL